MNKGNSNFMPYRTKSASYSFFFSKQSNLDNKLFLTKNECAFDHA